MSATKDTPFTTVHRSERKFGYHHSPSIYYRDHDDEFVFVATHFGEQQTIPGIYQLNLKTESFSLLTKYPNKFTQPFTRDYPAIFMDQQHNVIYLCAPEAEFGVFDLNNKTWELFEFKTKHHCSESPSVCFIPSKNELHLSYTITHGILNTKNKTFMVADYFPSFEPILYVPSTKQIMVIPSCLSRKKNDIYFCDVEEQNQISYKWRQYPLALPFKGQLVFPKHVVAFNTVLFVFYPYNEACIGGEIWCLDLLTNKWFKSPYKFPKQFGGLNKFHILKSDDNIAHFVQFQTVQFHGKVCLYDLIPKEMYESCCNYYKPLVMGWFRQQQQNETWQHLPVALKYIVLTYYPYFV